MCESVEATSMTDPPERSEGGRPDVGRVVYYRDPNAPRPDAVVPSVFVAATDSSSRILLVRRCDSGRWELPGGRVDVGESALSAARRETAEESGVLVQITGLVGIYTEPGHVVVAADGTARQQFVVVFLAEVTGGRPRGDQGETCAAEWFEPAMLARLPMDLPVRRWIADALRGDAGPNLS